MLYAILCYNDEKVTTSWSKEREETVIGARVAVQEKLAKKGCLGPVARLMPTTAATSVRKGKETMVIDGPFAETKEQLLGFYVVDCPSLDEAIVFAKELGGSEVEGTFEIRPLALYNPGALGPNAALR